MMKMMGYVGKHGVVDGIGCEAGSSFSHGGFLCCFHFCKDTQSIALLFFLLFFVYYEVMYIDTRRKGLHRIISLSGAVHKSKLN